MKIGKKGIVISLVFAAAAVTLISCGGGGGGSDTNTTNNNNVTLTGSVGSGYQAAPKLSTGFFANMLSYLGIGTPAYAALTDPVVDQVVAIPVDHGSLRSDAMTSRVTSSIDSSGNFSMTLSKNYDWLVILINSAATGTNRYVGSVGISTGSDSLLNLPATVAAIANLDLGAVTRATTSSTDAISTNSVTGTEFSMTATQLTTFAKADDLFRNAKNIVNNYDTATGVYYQLRSDFSFTGVYSQLTTTFSDPAYGYMGMNFQMDTTSPSVTMSDLCSVGTVTVELVPPGDVYSSDTAITYNVSNPLSSGVTPSCTPLVISGVTSTQVWSGDIYATDAYTQGMGGMSYSTGPRFTSLLPDGYWIWMENDVPKAWFDITGVNPPVTSSGKPQGFVPSFKINLVSGATTTGQIDSVDVQWYYYDETSDSYVLLAPSDLAVLKHFIGKLEVKFDVTYLGTRKTCEMYFDPSTTTRVSPLDPTFACPDTWYYNDPTHPETNTGLMGFYESGGFGHFFNFFIPIN